MKKFLKKYLIPGQDKLEHFYLWGLFYYAMRLFGVNKNLAFTITVGSAFLKEVLYDGVFKKGSLEAGDFLAGSAIALIDLAI